ncbi:hypothetical protein E2K80_15790 [Rhodophyticola sp. CCM32]|uniref:hypothetical protein n=1 Tax=Rhodophyticola sp. CCM32 TaxID=2916397 RepID=UPI00107F9400|nr:hypothetical protein [Rhodophyticola sp. CCM32]QBY02010.1 hypothetical protein E2K80_15790 [Rhodophyticola sp. CCM32]
MHDGHEISEVIRRVVAEQLDPARIVDVTVSDDVDHDDEPILRVEVIFEVEGDRLDPKKVMGLVRHLREPLQALHEKRFPMISFLTLDEFSGAAA